MIILADLIEGISSLVTSVMGKIGDIFLKYFFGIFVRPLFKLMDTFIEAMLMLAGINPIGTGDSDNLITTFLQKDGISDLYMYIAIFSAVLLIVLAIVEVIKKDFFSEEVKDSHAKVIRKVFLGMLYIIAIPPVFLFAVSVVSKVFELLWNIDGINQLSTLSQTIFELCLTKPEWMVRAELLGADPVTLAPVPHWSVITSDQLATLTTIYDFNFVIFLGVLGVAFYSMFMLAFAFAKRIFRIVLLYAIGPIAVAQSVNDDSKFSKWKGDVIQELISIFGTLISLVIFIIFCTELQEITFLSAQVETTNTSTIALINMVIKALFMLVAFSVIRGGDNILKTVVGGNISIKDGEGAFNDVKSAVNAATAPYKQVANAGKKAIGAVKGAYEGAYGLAAGTVRGVKAFKQGGVGGILSAATEKSRKKWHDATRIEGEESWDEKVKREKSELSGIEAHSTRNNERPIDVFNGLRSNDSGRFRSTLENVRDVQQGAALSSGAAAIDSTSGLTRGAAMDTINTAVGTSLNATHDADDVANQIMTKVQTASAAELGNMEIRVSAAITQADADITSARTQYNNAVAAGMTGSALDSRLEAVRSAEAQKQILVGVQETIKIQRDVTKIDNDYTAARSSGSREDVRAAQQAAVDLAKKESN